MYSPHPDLITIGWDASIAMASASQLGAVQLDMAMVDDCLRRVGTGAEVPALVDFYRDRGFQDPVSFLAENLIKTGVVPPDIEEHINEVWIPIAREEMLESIIACRMVCIRIDEEVVATPQPTSGNRKRRRVNTDGLPEFTSQMPPPRMYRRFHVIPLTEVNITYNLDLINDKTEIFITPRPQGGTAKPGNLPTNDIPLEPIPGAKLYFEKSALKSTGDLKSIITRIRDPQDQIDRLLAEYCGAAIELANQSFAVVSKRPPARMTAGDIRTYNSADTIAGLEAIQVNAADLGESMYHTEQSRQISQEIADGAVHPSDANYFAQSNDNLQHSAYGIPHRSKWQTQNAWRLRDGEEITAVPSAAVPPELNATIRYNLSRIALAFGLNATLVLQELTGNQGGEQALNAQEQGIMRFVKRLHSIFEHDVFTPLFFDLYGGRIDQASASMVDSLAQSQEGSVPQEVADAIWNAMGVVVEFSNRTKGALAETEGLRSAGYIDDEEAMDRIHWTYEVKRKQNTSPSMRREEADRESQKHAKAMASIGEKVKVPSSSQREL